MHNHLSPCIPLLVFNQVNFIINKLNFPSKFIEFQLIGISHPLQCTNQIHTLIKQWKNKKHNQWLWKLISIPLTNAFKTSKPRYDKYPFLWINISPLWKEIKKKEKSAIKNAFVRFQILVIHWSPLHLLSINHRAAFIYIANHPTLSKPTTNQNCWTFQYILVWTRPKKSFINLHVNSNLGQKETWGKRDGGDEREGSFIMCPLPHAVSIQPEKKCQDNI